jgi:hypothetical protein
VKNWGWSTNLVEWSVVSALKPNSFLARGRKQDTGHDVSTRAGTRFDLQLVSPLLLTVYPPLFATPLWMILFLHA